MDDQPTYEFTSHISGKNAAVRIYTDRVEWERPRSATGKLVTGVATLGVSLIAGRDSSRSSEVIPMSKISSVTTKRDGLRNSKVVIVTSGNTIEMRVSHAEAQTVKDTITRLIV